MSTSTTTAPGQGQLRSVEQLAAFIFAGHAVFTLVSNRTGERLTFRIRRSKSNGRTYADLLTGPDNENDFTPLGYINFYENGPRAWAHRSVNWQSSTFRTLEWLIRRIRMSLNTSPDDPNGATVHHAGRCGRCGRTLTVPESIETGLGPECASKGGA